MVFLSGGITHASFGGLGISWFLGINPILGATVFSIIAALGIEYLTERTNVRQDSMIGIWWSLGMSIGIVFICLTPGYTPNLMNYLFGSILAIEQFDLIMSAILTILVLTFFIIFLRPIQFISFDSEYAKTHGINIAVFKYILISIVALTIVFSIKVAGIVLIISLMTVPQAIANMFTSKYTGIMALSVLFAFAGSLAGLIFSWFVNIPSGASIIISLSIMFILVKIIFYYLHKLK